MPHDVTMPQLGMAQDAGRIVSWLKHQGDPVAEGDPLFEVETDKATMEVAAQTAGYLADVSAVAGDDVPVGTVIARIVASAGAAPDAPVQDTDVDAAGERSTDLPEGTAVNMPQLGMAQDTGLLIAWRKQPGDAVAADDVLFEVETDKSTMEVPAGVAGYLAATLAGAGDEVPVGDPVAIVSDAPPDRTIARGAAAAAPAPKAARVSAPAAAAGAPAPPGATTTVRARTDGAPAPGPDGRVLASPKARRLAREQGLDLNRLVAAGHPQPYHVADLDVLRSLPADAPATGATAPARHLTAEVARDGFAGFAAWASETAGLDDANALLAGLAAAGLGRRDTVVSVETPSGTHSYLVPPGLLSAITRADADARADLRVRDLRPSRVTSVALGPEDAPVLSIAGRGAGLSITLECAADQLDARQAVHVLSEFAGRMEQPLRHLL